MENKIHSTLEYLFPTFVGVVAQVESLLARMSEVERQVEGLFEGLLSESFGGK